MLIFFLEIFIRFIFLKLFKINRLNLKTLCGASSLKFLRASSILCLLVLTCVPYVFSKKLFNCVLCEFSVQCPKVFSRYTENCLIFNINLSMKRGAYSLFFEAFLSIIIFLYIC